MVRKQIKLRSKETKHERQAIPYLGEMDHHALACGSTSLKWGRNGSMEMEERECGWLGRQMSQGIHGQHNSMQGRSCLRVTPHPPFIAFSRALASLPFADCVMLSWFHCEICAIVLPLVLGCCVCKYLLGCY